jgi:hypothetical protein
MGTNNTPVLGTPRVGSAIKHKESGSIAIVSGFTGGSAYAKVVKGCGKYNKGDNVIWLMSLVEVQ